jgi:LysR family transcriptional regulator of gallate degradation
VRHAELIEVGLERALKEIRTHERAAVGPLLIGVTPIAAAQLVPRALRRLRQETPNLSASVLEMAFADAMPALLKGQIDLMVGPVGVYAKVDGVEEERLTPTRSRSSRGRDTRCAGGDRSTARARGRRLGFAE